MIIGAGAAGLFCAAEAARRGRRVAVLERNAQPGRKIIISGGGRCNFTNVHTRPENFVSQNPHFCKSALARYAPADFIDLVKKHRIEFYEKKLGQLFCRGRSYQIVELLLNECDSAGAEVRTGVAVKSVTAENGEFSIASSAGEFTCTSLVIATGGLSFPKIGATGFGYDVARQFGLKIVDTRPSLVPLVFSDGKPFAKLSGISVDSAVSSGAASFRENILFTHRGLSGPAILQISNYWKKSQPIAIDLLPDNDAREILGENRASRQLLDNFMARYLPKRFAELFISLILPNRPLDQFSKKELDNIAHLLNHWQVSFADTEGYDKAEVTLGGVSTSELSSQTMEAKRVPGLYFIGEVVDVTGWLGGYNFQWAWSSGFAAAQSV